MAAVTYPDIHRWAPAAPAVLPSGHPRPVLRGARVRRRRAAASVALAIAAVMAAATIGRSLAGLGGGALTTSGPAGAAAVGGGDPSFYIVQPGDTLWSIVGSRSVGGDRRPAVDRLAGRLGGVTLQPGQRIALP